MVVNPDFQVPPIRQSQQIRVTRRASGRELFNAHVVECAFCADPKVELCPTGQRLLLAALES